MRLAFLHDNAGVCLTLAEALTRQGHSSVLVVPRIYREWDAYSSAPLRVIFTDTYRVIPTLIALTKELPVDVTISNNPTSWVVGASLRTLGLCKHAVILHGGDIRKAAGREARKLIGLLALRQSDVIFGTTPDLVEVGKRFGIGVTYLPTPVNTQLFAQASVPPSGNDRPLIFSPTRLDFVKGAPIIVQLIGMLAKRFPHGKIVQVSYFEDADTQYVEQLRRDNKAQNISLIPFVPYSEMADWYRRSDLVIGQFKIGMAGLVELQAMSCGTPVAFFDQQYGYGVNAPSPELAYDFAVNAITQQEYRSALVRKGLDIARGTHESNRVAAEFVNRIERIL